MTMHLERPYITLTGKRKGKQKFRNSEEAKKARELEQLWQENQSKWKAMSKVIDKGTKFKTLTYSPKVPPGRETPKIPSLNTNVTGPVTTKKSQHYTGDQVIGITIVHKSCLQPVFTQQEAIDAANMRR